MANLLQSAKTWLAGQRDDHMSTTVIYNRGTVVATLPVKAMMGLKTYQIQDADGLIVAQQSMDFCFTPPLTISGSVTVPRNGDRITVGTVAYEVADFGGMHCYEQDGYGTQIRVHTKQVSA